MKPAEFLQELWGEKPPGLILVWELADKRSRYFKAPAGAVAISAGQPDVYTGVGLSDKDYGKHRRTPNDEIRAIPGLWADIDVNGGPDEKTGAAPDKIAAARLADSILSPTIVVDSGYGLQAWWLFKDPWIFRTRGEQKLAALMAAQWQKRLRDAADFGLDHTHDLARVLRLPGTSNAKGKERVPVRVEGVGPRYSVELLRVYCAEAGDVDPGYRMNVKVDVNVQARPDTTCPKLDELIKQSPRFRRTWNVDRDDLPEDSWHEWDLSLASMAAFAGWTDQEIADLVATFRRRVDPDGRKAARVDYLRSTVARARVPLEDHKEGEPKERPTVADDAWAEAIVEGLTRDDSGVIALPFKELSEPLDGGLRPGDVCIIGGYTSHGKSVLLDQIADFAAGQGRRAHLYLTEMTLYERGLRLLARKTGIPFRELRRREKLDDKERWQEILAVISSMPYGCTNVSEWTVEDVCADIIKSKWDLAIVDLVHGFHYTDERDLAKTSGALMRTAKAGAGTTIVSAVHLNDGQITGQKGNKKPKPGLHSIMGSSSLKKDADVAMFVWQEEDDAGVPQETGEIWIAKSRNGGFGSVKVWLDTDDMLFKEQIWLQDELDEARQRRGAS